MGHGDGGELTVVQRPTRPRRDGEPPPLIVVHQPGGDLATQERMAAAWIAEVLAHTPDLGLGYATWAFDGPDDEHAGALAALSRSLPDDIGRIVVTTTPRGAPTVFAALSDADRGNWATVVVAPPRIARGRHGQSQLIVPLLPDDVNIRMPSRWSWPRFTTTRSDVLDSDASTAAWRALAMRERQALARKRHAAERERRSLAEWGRDGRGDEPALDVREADLDDFLRTVDRAIGPPRAWGSTPRVLSAGPPTELSCVLTRGNPAVNRQVNVVALSASRIGPRLPPVVDPGLPALAFSVHAGPEPTQPWEPAQGALEVMWSAQPRGLRRDVKFLDYADNDAPPRARPVPATRPTTPGPGRTWPGTHAGEPRRPPAQRWR